MSKINTLIQQQIDTKPNVYIKKATRTADGVKLGDTVISNVYPIVSPTTNDSGEGAMVILNNVLFLYLEYLQFFPELKATLQKVSVLMQQMQQPLGTSPQGFTNDPALMQKATEVSSSINELIAKLP
jgi:hypothetical protein